MKRNLLITLGGALTAIGFYLAIYNPEENKTKNISYSNSSSKLKERKLEDFEDLKRIELLTEEITSINRGPINEETERWPERLEIADNITKSFSTPYPDYTAHIQLIRDMLDELDDTEQDLIEGHFNRILVKNGVIAHKFVDRTSSSNSYYFLRIDVKDSPTFFPNMQNLKLTFFFRDYQESSRMGGYVNGSVIMPAQEESDSRIDEQKILFGYELDPYKRDIYGGHRFWWTQRKYLNYLPKFFYRLHSTVEDSYDTTYSIPDGTVESIKKSLEKIFWF